MTPQLNVCSLGWVIESNKIVRSVTCVSLSFPELANRWEGTSHLLPCSKSATHTGTSSTRETQGHTGSRLAGQKHVGIFTNDRVEADPAVQPIDRWNVLVLT